MIKRSLSIKGHRTSISIEEPFWQVLAGIARREGLSLSALVARIDLERTAALARGANMGGLSSEIRIYVLKDVLSRIDRRIGSKSC